MKKLAGLIVMMVVVMNVCPVFADDAYHDRNFFNRMTDWGATFWRSPDEKERVTQERIERRAEWRERRDREHPKHDDERK